MTWDFVVILIFLAIAVPLLGRHRVRQLLRMPQTTGRQRLRLYFSTIFGQWALAGVIAWRCNSHQVSMASLGVEISRPVLTALTSVALGGLLLTNQVFSIREIVKQPDPMGNRMPFLAMRIFPQNRGEQAAFVAVVATVSVCEEVIYRGFVQWAFQRASSGLVLAGVASSAIFFGAAHLYQGRKGMAVTGIMGFIFSAIRAWTKSLLPCVIAHFITDLSVGLLLPARLRSLGNSSSTDALAP